ncbi:hypothetical protein, partial [Staphylococcus aureus]
HSKAVVDALHAVAAAPAGVGAGDAAEGEWRAAAHLLRRAIAAGDDRLYRAYSDLVAGRPPATLRDLLDVVPAGPAVT